MAKNGILYLRSAELIVGKKIEDTNEAIEPVFAKVFRTRIKFKIVSTDGGNANKAKISVYNLNEESKTFLEQDDMVVFLRTGYAGELTQLFFGDLERFEEKRSGGDVITTLECGDGEKILKDANIQIGLGPGATRIQILNLAIAKLKLSRGYQTFIPDNNYQNGFSFSGPVSRLMDEILEPLGLKWNIQGGELQIMGTNETDRQTAVLLTPTTGMIDYPTKTKDGVQFKSLLNPRIRPGRAVRLESKRFLDGSGANVKTSKCTYEGDSSEGKWQVTCEGVIKDDK